MKLIRLIVLFVLASLYVVPVAFGGPIAIEGYGDAKWGMTKEQVTALVPGLEDSPNVKGALEHETNVGGVLADAVYMFTDDNKLYRVIFFVKLQTSNVNKYVDTYDELLALLTGKYGKPGKSIRRGSTNRFMSDGEWISSGKGGYIASWTGKMTLIWIKLDGDNSKCHLTLFYESPSLNAIVQAEREKKKQNSL